MPGSSLRGVHVKANLVKVSHAKAYRKVQMMQIPPAGQVWKSYYFLGNVRIAMRTQVNGASDQVYYLLADHLGSTTVSYRADGGDTRFQSYKPWGEFRGGGNSLTTDRTFTGQRWEEVGLYYFNARWYDAYLNRWVQPDSIIPEPGNVLDWDRYAYARNNPVKYIDPTGHATCDEEGNCFEKGRKVPGIRYGPPTSDWRDDPGYDRESDSIKDWGVNWKQTYMERAKKVWGWMCDSSGWWGSGCPNTYDLAAWLLQHEIGKILDKYYKADPESQRAAMLVVTYTYYLFSDGIDPQADLGKYTSIYNSDPSSPSYNSNDWNQLNTAPVEGAYNTVDAYKNQPYPYPGRDLVWWSPSDSHAPPYTTYLFEVKRAKLHFALK